MSDGIHESEIGWLLPEGRAGGRLPDGQVFEVDRGVPGDRVRWQPVGRRGKVVVGRVGIVTRASHDRRPPTCPWTDRCGGCDLAHLDRRARHGALADLVQRVFGFATPPEVVPSPREMGHRARIKLTIDGVEVGYRAAASHTLVPVSACAIARPEINAKLTALREALAGRPPTGASAVELRSDGARVVLSFLSAGRVERDAFTDFSDAALDGSRLSGDPTLTLTVAGRPLRASPLSFYQVNLELNERLVAHVAEAILAAKPERLLDLYAGIGNFGVPIAASGVPVLAVESEGQAIGDLRHNAAGLPVEVTQAKLPAWDPSKSAFDAVILDPPRSGIGPMMSRLLALRPRIVVYVACDPVAGSRDVRSAQALGYRLVSLRCFDLFPDTHHLETVAILERGPRRS